MGPRSSYDRRGRLTPPRNSSNLDPSSNWESGDCHYSYNHHRPNHAADDYRRPHKRQRTRSRSPEARWADEGRHPQYSGASHWDDRPSDRYRDDGKWDRRPSSRDRNSVHEGDHSRAHRCDEREQAYRANERRGPVAVRRQRSRSWDRRRIERSAERRSAPLSQRPSRRHTDRARYYPSPDSPPRSPVYTQHRTRTPSPPRNFILDLRGDPDNLTYGCLPASSIPVYRRIGFGRVMGVEDDLKIDRTQSSNKEIIMCEGRRRERDRGDQDERDRMWGQGGFGALVNQMEDGMPEWMKKGSEGAIGNSNDAVDVDHEDRDLIKLHKEDEIERPSGTRSRSRTSASDDIDVFGFRYGER